MLEALATGSALTFGHLHHEHHGLRTNGKNVDAPLSFAPPPILPTVAMRADNGLFLDRKMKLNPAYNILRAAILVAFAHPKRVI